MARTWLSIRVELVSGRDLDIWPRPGRIFAAARSATFAQLARSIDLAFARWDLAHLYQFRLADGTYIGQPEYDHFDQGFADGNAVKLSRLALGEQFVYEFDFGDSWTHLCTVDTGRIDPVQTLGAIPYDPQPYFGWGELPDQHGRRFLGDLGEKHTPLPPDPKFTDLPPLLPYWGPTEP